MPARPDSDAPEAPGEVEAYTAALIAEYGPLAPGDHRRPLAASAMVLARSVDAGDVSAAREWRLTLAAIRGPSAQAPRGPVEAGPDFGDQLEARRKARRMALRERYGQGFAR